VRLRFDRAVDAAGLVASAVTVDDGPLTGSTWQADGNVAMVDPQTVQLELAETGASSSSSTTLTAAAGNGIVAADDGGTWAGVTGVELPFP
jgi:hypothetical protein